MDHEKFTVSEQFLQSDKKYSFKIVYKTEGTNVNMRLKFMKELNGKKENYWTFTICDKSEHVGTTWWNWNLKTETFEIGNYLKN